MWAYKVNFVLKPIRWRMRCWLWILLDFEKYMLDVFLALWPMQPSWRYFKDSSTETAFISYICLAFCTQCLLSFLMFHCFYLLDHDWCSADVFKEETTKVPVSYWKTSTTAHLCACAGYAIGFFLYFFFLLTLLLLHQVLILSANYLQVSVFYKTLLSFICVSENFVLYKFHCLPVISIS